MTDLTYVTRSRFLARCRDAIRAVRGALEAGRTVSVRLEEGGYAGRVVVTIPGAGDGTFRADWASTDATRFPARIRAAATALRDCGVVGRFLITHDDGLLEIKAD